MVQKYWRWVVVMAARLYLYCVEHVDLTRHYQIFKGNRTCSSLPPLNLIPKLFHFSMSVRGVIYACDCSKEALERAKEMINAANSICSETRFHPFQCDFSILGFPSWLACNSCSGSFSQKHNMELADANTSLVINDPNPFCADGHRCCIGGVDFVTLIFTLSAVPLDRMPKAVAQCFAVLKPGGLLLFRDYGLYDMTMLRYEPEQRIGNREYLRSDGTRSYFFCLNTVRSLTSAAGFTELELEYCCVKSVNRRNGKIMKRVWVHGKFQKPMCFPDPQSVG